LYADELGRKYSGLKPYKTAAQVSNNSDGTVEQAYSTDEGPVVITRRGKLVFVSESFDLTLARKLATLILGAQGSGPLQSASAGRPSAVPGAQFQPAGFGQRETLTAPMVRLLSDCGVTKAVVDAVLQASHPDAMVPFGQR
jgi:hypothetical protein